MYKYFVGLVVGMGVSYLSILHMLQFKPMDPTIWLMENAYYQGCLAVTKNNYDRCQKVTEFYAKEIERIIFQEK